MLTECVNRILDAWLLSQIELLISFTQCEINSLPTDNTSSNIRLNTSPIPIRLILEFFFQVWLTCRDSVHSRNLIFLYKLENTGLQLLFRNPWMMEIWPYSPIIRTKIRWTMNAVFEATFFSDGGLFECFKNPMVWKGVIKNKRWIYGLWGRRYISVDTEDHSLQKRTPTFCSSGRHLVALEILSHVMWLSDSVDISRPFCKLFLKAFLHGSCFVYQFAEKRIQTQFKFSGDHFSDRTVRRLWFVLQLDEARPTIRPVRALLAQSALQWASDRTTFIVSTSRQPTWLFPIVKKAAFKRKTVSNF